MRSLMICTAQQILCGDKMEKNKMGWACGAYGEWSCIYSVLVGKPEGKRTLGRTRGRWRNIIMDL
jgi:hypothetical protein